MYIQIKILTNEESSLNLISQDILPNKGDFRLWMILRPRTVTKEFNKTKLLLIQASKC